MKDIDDEDMGGSDSDAPDTIEFDLWATEEERAVIEGRLQSSKLWREVARRLRHTPGVVPKSDAHYQRTFSKAVEKWRRWKDEYVYAPLFKHTETFKVSEVEYIESKAIDSGHPLAREMLRWAKIWRRSQNDPCGQKESQIIEKGQATALQTAARIRARAHDVIPEKETKEAQADRIQDLELTARFDAMRNTFGAMQSIHS